MKKNSGHPRFEKLYRYGKGDTELLPARDNGKELTWNIVIILEDMLKKRTN